MAGEVFASQTSVYPAQNGSVTVTEADVFIPEIWSDEVIAAYKLSLVMGEQVSKMPMTGKKGDTIHVPKPTRGVANKKVARTAVTIQSEVEDEVVINIDQHFEYSRFIEDIVDKQALSSMRQFYTNDAGYALARQVDTHLHECSTGFGDGTLTLDVADVQDGAAFAGNTNILYSTTGAAGSLASYAADTVDGAVFTDALFRDLVQKLDDSNVPMDNRKFIIPPSLRNVMMGIDRYVSSDFINGRPVENGMIGELYGVKIYVSTNCLTVESAANNSASSNDLRMALMYHPDAIVHAEQMSVRSQSQYKQEFLADLFTADTLYGVQVMRPEAGFGIVVSE